MKYCWVPAFAGTNGWCSVSPMTASHIDWPDKLFVTLKRAGIRQVGYVPDAGHSAYEPGIVHELISATDAFAVTSAAGAK